MDSTRPFDKAYITARTTVVNRGFRIDGQPSPCWEWGSRLPDGYGKSTKAYRELGTSLVHRAAYLLWHGPIANEIDHLCRNRPCCNPDHLEDVTAKTNTRRSESPCAENAQKTHCPQGHPLSGKNVYLYRGSRYCRACITVRTRQYRARRRAGHRSV